MGSRTLSVLFHGSMAVRATSREHGGPNLSENWFLSLGTVGGSAGLGIKLKVLREKCDAGPAVAGFAVDPAILVQTAEEGEDFLELSFEGLVEWLVITRLDQWEARGVTLVPEPGPMRYYLNKLALHALLQ